MVRKYQKTEYKQWSDDDIATLIEFYPNTKTIDLVPVLHRSKQSIDHKAQRLGLKKTDELDLVKIGEIEPKRCEKCEYCKQTKRLTAPSVFEPEGV